MMRSLGVVFAACLIAGCEDPASFATDEDLILLLGERVSVTSAESPLLVSQTTARCMKLVAGLPLDDAEQLPRETLLIETERCTQNLRHSLTEPYRNSAVLIFEDFRDVALAERVISLAAEHRSIHAELHAANRHGNTDTAAPRNRRAGLMGLSRDGLSDPSTQLLHRVALHLETSPEPMEPVSK